MTKYLPVPFGANLMKIGPALPEIGLQETIKNKKNETRDYFDATASN